jgi:hypothetical protein
LTGLTLNLSGGEFWARFAAASLATWRIAHLLAYEDGPGDLLVRFRAWLSDSFLGKLMDCFSCLSLWVALLFAPVVTFRFPEVALIWVALSGAACLLERGTAPAVQVERLRPGPEESVDRRDVGE